MCAAGRLNSFEQGQRAALQWLLHSFFTTEVDERSSFKLKALVLCGIFVKTDKVQ